MFRLRNYRLVALCSILFLFFGAFVNAEDLAPKSGPDEPAETEIILPEMYLEIEDLSVEEINAVIPDNDSVLLSSLELPLPEPDQIEIPAEVFAVSELDAPASASAGGAENSSSFFSEGTIGVGTSANITGDINLYHIGEQPDFRLRYFHDSYDGFSGAEAGKGFSSREELIEAELNYSEDGLSVDLLLKYHELESGLQGLTDYFSLTRRIPELDADVNWFIRDNLRLTGNLNAQGAGFQLNALTPLAFGLFSIDPEIGIVYGSDSLNVGLMLDYNIAGETSGNDINQGLGGRLIFNAEPSELFRISAEAGLLWDNYGKFVFPFQLGLAGTASLFDYNLTGGWIARYENRVDLWEIYPTAAGPETVDSLGSIPLTSGWVVDGDFRMNLSENLLLRASADFSMLNNALIPAASSLTGFNTLTAVDSTCFGTGVGIYMKISDNFTFDLGWKGQLLEDMDWFSPRHLIQTELELTSDDRDMGVIGNAELRIYDAAQSWYTNDWLPVIGLEAYLRIADGFVFSVSGEDLAAGFISTGRNDWNGFLDMGAVLQAKIKISL